MVYIALLLCIYHPIYFPFLANELLCQKKGQVVRVKEEDIPKYYKDIKEQEREDSFPTDSFALSTIQG